MSNSVNFKFGSTLTDKTVAENDLVVINEGIAEGGDKRYGSIYKGDKIVGTTEAENLYTTEDIQIAGGPLADKMSMVFKNGKIPAGTSLHDFIKLLACTDTYPVATSTAGTFSTSISAPTISANVKSGTVVELGSTTTIDKISAVATSPSATPAKVTGLTYGYKTSADGDKNSTTSISKDWSYSVNADDKYSLSATASGFTGLVNASDSDAVLANCYLDSQTLTVGLGANTLTVSETGVGYTGSVDGIDSVWIVSNIGSTSDDHKTTALTAQSNVERNPDAKSATYKLTGVYPVYNNINGSALKATVDNKMALADNTVFEISFPAEGANRVAFAYPANRTVTAEVYNTMAKAYETYSGSYTDVAEADKRDINGNSVQYNVWTRVDENANDAVKFKFTLSKKTSVA